MSRIFVAMSGGVDSSLAAALCVQSGADVIGVTMRLMPVGEDPLTCGGTSAINDARKVCETLGIPHTVLDLREVFEREVIAPFVREYAEGRTPNPCILCNDRVKFAELMTHVLTESGDTLVTGHYAQIAHDEAGIPWLERGLDVAKDQSYFLYRLQTDALARLSFPLGCMSKSEVRRMAKGFDLPTAHRRESQEICFVEDGEAGQFVIDRVPTAGRPGPVVDAQGEVLGTHNGIARYTIGQRKGLAISGEGRRYVTSVDATRNQVILGERSDLSVLRITADDLVWRGDDLQRVDVQVRYHMPPVRGEARRVGHELHVMLDEPLGGIAPGQAVVCYQDQRVLGGGVVSRTE